MTVGYRIQVIVIGISAVIMKAMKLRRKLMRIVMKGMIETYDNLEKY